MRFYGGKMAEKIKRSIVMALILVIFLPHVPAFAKSKSVTIKTSCVIPASVRLVIKDGVSIANKRDSNFSTLTGTSSERQELGMQTSDSLVSIKTNLGRNNYRLSEKSVDSPKGPIRLYSLTAL